MKKRINLGAIFWVSSIQYFVVQLIAANAWKTSFSLSSNTISDLGNTVCGQYGDRFVCSPLYSWMNLSFAILGITQILGAYFLRNSLKKRRLSDVGFAFMAVAGIGTLLVGFFPENSVGALHVLGAALPFVVGNLGLLLLGYSLELSKNLRFITILFGVVALISLVFFLFETYLGLGIGGLERIVAYPQTIWLIIFGASMLKRQKLLDKTSKK